MSKTDEEQAAANLKSVICIITAAAAVAADQCPSDELPECALVISAHGKRERARERVAFSN